MPQAKVRTKQIRPKSYRQLHIKGEVWLYKIGRAFVRILDPQQNSTVVQKANFPFPEQDRVGVVDWTGDSEPNVYSPQVVKDYIERNLLK